MYKTQTLARAICQLTKMYKTGKVLDNEKFCLRLARLQLRLAIELTPTPAR